MSEAESAQCPRSWEVEAVRDGRLREQDAESLLRHLRTCVVCQREREQLAALGRDLVELPPPRLDALAGRRVRQRVLTLHNAWLLQRERAATPLPPRFAWATAAALVVLAGAGAAWRLQRTPTAAAPAHAVEQPPTVDVVPSAGARWSQSTSAHGARVSLDAGELRLSIRRHSPRDRVLVLLPDGEIEDFGTILRVAVAHGGTESVRVEQGRVAVRFRNQEPISLVAGQSWTREQTEVAPSASAALRPPAEPAAKPLARHPAHAAVRPRATDTHLSAAPAVAPSAETPSAETPSAETPSAETPSADGPSATRAEDDAYLGVVELVRAGKLDAARAAAKDYLLRFPNGFRRVEVLNIATDAQ